MKILVCGGREYADQRFVFDCLDAVARKHQVTAIIHGAAKGADSLGDQWAKAKGITSLPFPADWQAHGKRAGFLRNSQMLSEGKPDAVVAFTGGRGTAMMVKLAKDAGVPVWEPN
jgi:hypothetical protein